MPKTDVRIFEGDLDKDFAAVMKSAASIAVDTETTGLDFRSDQLQLVQLHSPLTGSALIRVNDAPMTNVQDLLADSSIAKVFHFAPFDLRFLCVRLGSPVTNVRCTKAASKLISPHMQSDEHSLKSLLARYQGVNLEKGSTRTSNWGAPRLSTKQVSYAVKDVQFLLPLHEQLEQELKRDSLDELYTQICHYMPVDALIEVQGYPNPLAY